jgi:GNAT superfamily N-acetyltransferase
MSLVERVCSAYAWHRALGHETRDDGLCRIVTDRDNPDLWDANHVSMVRAATTREIDGTLERADEAFGHCRHRLFVVDPTTPPEFVARLALEDYEELTPTIQLVLEGELGATPPGIDIRPVVTDDDWRSLHELVRSDHQEGARSHDGPLSEEITRGTVAAYRKKSPACQFFLARSAGVDSAYGAAVRCEGRVGMVEDLFTLPAFRKRGIATAMIGRAIRHVREAGADCVLIGAHATDPPKRLYARLGFVPVCMTREYIKHM